MCSWKTYDIDTQNLVAEHHSTRPYLMAQATQLGDRALMYSDLFESWSDDTTTYNFLGNVLTKSHSVTKKLQDTSTTSENSSVSYAYWGPEKYYQQKAIKDQGGRLSYTDYYDNSSTQGKKGQTYRVYDQARASIYLDTGVTPPSYATSGTEWRYQVKVGDLSQYSSQFDYDTKSRAVDVWKIQKTTTSPWTYVQTHTSYGADTDGSWGQANEVIEDYGGINRTTDTLQYDSFGRAIKVQDASGKVFHTTYDDDGIIQSIERIVGSTSVPVVTYTYGASGVTNRAVLSVTDNLSGVSQSISYGTSGISIGMPVSATETNGSDSYSTAYTYTSAGDRDTATYTTQSGLGLGATTKWKYSDYLQVGEPTNSSRIFTTLTAIDPSTGYKLPEEFHYVYDTAGRPIEATFAMTPQAWTPSAGGSY
jgi:YD repeat-containing protein